MSAGQSPDEVPRQAGLGYRLLERATAVVLVLVLLALGWMALAASLPEWGAGLELPVQVVLVVLLLAAALLLVSVVALLHTRS